MVISWLCSYIQQASLCCTKLFVENPPLLAALPYRLPPISFQENMFRTIYGSVLVVFCLFRFAGWSVGSSAQLHGCLVYTRHLNRLLLPPCTCGLILILLLLLLPDFPRVNPSFFLSPLRLYPFRRTLSSLSVLLLQSLQFLSRSLSFLIACHASNILPDLDYAPRFRGR